MQARSSEEPTKLHRKINEWSGRQNNENHWSRTADIITKNGKRKQPTRFMIWYDKKKCQSVHNKGSRRRQREGDWKGIWRNYDRKLPKPKEGNKYLVQKEHKDIS